MPSVAQTFPRFYLNLGKNRQAVDNGGFDIWQRGDVEVFLWGAFFADRWRFFTDSADYEHTLSKHELIPSDGEVFGVTPNTLNLEYMDLEGNASFAYIEQTIPDVAFASGKYVSVGFYANVNPPVTLPKVTIVQDFGSGGSPSAPVETILGADIPLSRRWEKYAMSALLPSIEGKSRGANYDDSLKLRIYLDTDTHFADYNLTAIQFNIGPQILPFSAKGEYEELMRCKQFYERIPVAQYGYYCLGLAETDITAALPFAFSPKYRPPHTIALSAPSDFALTDGTSNRAISSVTAFNIQEAGAAFRVNTTITNLTPTNVYALVATATNAFIEISADP